MNAGLSERDDLWKVREDDEGHGREASGESERDMGGTRAELGEGAG